MEYLNAGLTSKIFIGTILIAGLSYLAYKSYKRKETNEELESYSNIDKDEVESVIKKYFEDLRNDSKNYELANLYSYVFNIEDEQHHYESKISRKNFDELTSSVEESKYGRMIVKEIAEDVLKDNFVKKSTQVNFWIFLIDYNKIQGKISALNYINRNYNLSEYYLKKYDEHMKKNQSYLRSLISDVTSTIS